LTRGKRLAGRALSKNNKQKGRPTAAFRIPSTVLIKRAPAPSASCASRVSFYLYRRVLSYQ
jgi:hypothetical protein